MNILIENKKLTEVEADITIVLVLNKNLDHKWIEDKKELEFLGFEGESEEICLVGKTIYVGCESTDNDEIRLSSAKAINHIKKTKAKTVKVGTYSNDCPGVNIKAMSEAFILGSYAYEEYKSDKKPLKIDSISICLEDYNDVAISEKTAKQAVEAGTIIANATNFAKDLVNEIPYKMHSLKLEEMAKGLESLENVTSKSFGKEFLEEQKNVIFPTHNINNKVDIILNFESKDT